MLVTKGYQVKWEQVQELTQSLMNRVQQAADEAWPLHELERELFQGVLKMGHDLVDMFIGLQGDGDLGETIQTPDGRTLHRSEEPKSRPLRTVFGSHEFVQFVYSAGSGRTIELRPLDARMQLPAGVCSYLLEDFSQLFCVEQAFGLAAENFQTVFGQSLSVDTLEGINQRMAAPAGKFFDACVVPPPVEEGELTIITADCKGVPMVVGKSRELLPF